MSSAGPIRKTFVPTCVFAVLVILVSWIMNHIGSGAPGVGVGPSHSSYSAASGDSSPASSDVMVVIIRDDRYVVGRNALSAANIAQAAKSSGMMVRIIPGPDSRL